jgi:hypothetical protein
LIPALQWTLIKAPEATALLPVLFLCPKLLSAGFVWHVFCVKWFVKSLFSRTLLSYMFGLFQGMTQLPYLSLLCPGSWAVFFQVGVHVEESSLASLRCFFCLFPSQQPRGCPWVSALWTGACVQAAGKGQSPGKPMLYSAMRSETWGLISAFPFTEPFSCRQSGYLHHNSLYDTSLESGFSTIQAISPDDSLLPMTLLQDKN